MSTPSRETLRRYWRIGILAAPKERARIRAHARRMGLPTSSFIGIVLRNYAALPFRLELIREPESDTQ